MEEKSNNKRKRRRVEALEQENRSLRKRVDELTVIVVTTELVKRTQITALESRQAKLERMLLTEEQRLRLNRLCEGWVELEGVDRRTLFHALWLNARTCSGYELAYAKGLKPDPDVIDLDAIIREAKEGGRGYVDYAVGRKMKIVLFDESTTLINPKDYDEAWGQGTVQRTVNALRFR